MSSSCEDECNYECSVSYTYDPNNNKNILSEEDDNDDNRYSLRNLRISGSPNATTKNKVILKDLKSITTIERFASGGPAGDPSPVPHSYDPPTDTITSVSGRATAALCISLEHIASFMQEGSFISENMPEETIRRERNEF
ncbi:unnamed protein product [Strongylus vulgaris]|uniref:Uncharacterized protein n=1 Tax=Strongylus vulgaris TaxID=40348 RepID=A0A3P7L5D2_STRVU|nr:unnamed protein product [Strongylus vulgaris]